MSYKFILPSVLSVFVLSSCMQRMYFPDRANVMGFKEAHEAKITASIKPQSDSVPQVSPAVDIAFAPVNHIGIFGSYRSTLNRTISEDVDYLYTKQIGGTFNGHRFEGGAGYFTPFGRIGDMEILAGIGEGTMQRVGVALPDYNYNSKYFRFFIQPAAGFSNDVFSLMGGFRIAFNHYYDFQSANPDLRYDIGISNHPADVTGQLLGFFEPFINMEVGYKYIKFDFQTGATAQFTGVGVSGNLPAYISLGATFNYAPRFFNKEKKSNKKEY
ncbi:MAG TPA: hypothetical protein VN721_04580 [Flavipsychrobacter sp.]|nr:hypothetical protein [Flavipsychrobacter sp.]